MGKNIINIALFGLGRIGQMHANNLINHKNFNLKYIFDKDQKLSKKLSKKYNSIDIQNPKIAFKDKNIKCIFIASSTNTHLKFIEEAVVNKKVVFCEKPLAIDVDSITRIEEAMYNAEDPKIFLGFNRRFSGASQFIKEKLNIYPANAINFRFSVPKLERDHWTNIKEIGGGRIVGEAIHAIDLGTYFFDSLPQSISSHSPINKESDEVYDNQVFININYANGAHAAIQYFSDTNNKLSKERLEQIVDRTKKGGAEIVKFLEKGSAFYAPAASGVEMAKAYLRDEKKMLPCAAYLNGEYGIKDIYAGVPIIVGKNGVEKIEEINLDEKEKSEFLHSIDAVKKLWEAASKIDPDLNK